MAELNPLGTANIQGVFVREQDGTVSFNRIRQAGFTVVFLRATAGDDYVDCKLTSNERAATAAGLDVGYTHYLTARTVNDAKAQANYFLNTTSGKGYSLRPAVQFDRFRGLDDPQINAIVSAWLDTVQSSTGIAPMLRTDTDSAIRIWNASLAAKYPLWLIDPDVSTPQLPDDKWRGWTGWEYTGYGNIEGTDPLPLSLFTENVRAGARPVPGTKLICVTVAYGDTLSAIARLFNTTVNEIASLNNISNPNRIYPGQRLYIRVAGSTPAPCCDTYIVKRGDTLSAIAKRFGTTVDRLVAINQIADEDFITVNQVLNLGLCND